MNNLTFDKNGFYLDGVPFRLIAGDVHYFRIHPSRWSKILDLAKDFGLNTIQTYVPWNAHETEEGKFDFSGMLDLGAFLALCKEKDLKVLLRPAPYICSEWDLGGLPAWLLKDRDLVLRSHDPKYLLAVERYYQKLIPEFLPYLATRGGTVIAVTIENEYGSYGNDHEYLKAVADLLIKGGVDVPLYTTDGDLNQMLTFGRFRDDCFFGVNYRALPGTSQHAFEMAKKFGENKPFFVGEFWSGRSMHWGEPFSHRAPEEIAESYKEALELSGNVCFYMFAGGTNFGFMGGANIGKSFSSRPGTPVRYIPHTTSYDVDALVSEDGRPTKKYFLCRDVLDEHLGREKRPHVYEEEKKQTITVTLSESADLFENLDALTEKKDFAIIPKPMEDYGQNYGLILYSTKLNAFSDEPVALNPYRYRDRANIYVDGEWFATFLRDRGLTKHSEGAVVENGLPTFKQNGCERKIDVLVENIGRVNFGKEITEERKGMEDALISTWAKLYDYEVRCLPLKNLSGISWCDKPANMNKPTFFKGYFDAIPGVDTHVDFSEFGHGYVWVNGFNLGRYDSKGPQMTLYVPGALLKEKDNELIVFDVAPTNDNSTISLIDHEILEGDAELLD